MIQPGIPISQQRNEPTQPAVQKSPFEPSEIELDLMQGKFDRQAYNMAKQYMNNPMQPQQPEMQRQTNQQPHQIVKSQNEYDPEFLTNIEKTLAGYRQEALRQQQYAQQPAPQPVQQPQPMQTQPQAVQNEPVKTEQSADDEWVKNLLGNGEQPKPQTDPAQQQQTQQPAQTEQNKSYFNLDKEGAERLTNYLDANQRYYNAIEVEAQRRNIDPMKIAQALAQKPINEVVDFALGQYNNPVPNPQPVQTQPVQQPAQQQIIDPVDMGRQMQAQNQRMPQQEQVYGGDKEWAF